MHPRALAEQAALVDVLSDGRLELGLGAGYREDEFVGFDADRNRRFQTLEAIAGQLPSLWASGAVTPPPVQQPLPTWIGGRGPRCARVAGRLGAGLLWLDRELWTIYRDALVAAGHDPGSARVAASSTCSWPTIPRPRSPKSASRGATTAAATGVVTARETGRCCVSRSSPRRRGREIADAIAGMSR